MGRRSEWRGHIFDRKFLNSRLPFLRMRSEKKAKNRLLCCQIAKILAPFWAIAVTEHDGIQTRYKFNTVSKL